jgi:hypothetical protein
MKKIVGSGEVQEIRDAAQIQREIQQFVSRLTSVAECDEVIQQAGLRYQMVEGKWKQRRRRAGGTHGA